MLLIPLVRKHVKAKKSHFILIFLFLSTLLIRTKDTHRSTKPITLNFVKDSPKKITLYSEGSIIEKDDIKAVRDRGPVLIAIKEEYTQIANEQANASAKKKVVHKKIGLKRNITPKKIVATSTFANIKIILEFSCFTLVLYCLTNIF